MSESQEQTKLCLELAISLTGAHGSQSHLMRPGESILIGSGIGCQLRIEDNAIASHQCLLELREDESLWLHNWCMNGTTLLNGVEVEETVQIEPSHAITIGTEQLQFSQAETWADTGDEEESTAETTDEGIPKPDVVQQASVASDRNKTLSAAPAATPATPAARATPAPPEPSRPLAEPESVEDSTIQFLHRELALLQDELDERNAKIAELTRQSTVTPAAPVEDSVPKERLNDLLFELQLCDDRASNLEHELRLLDELRNAEQQEKQQIEAWVNEIEQRVARRESESEAELEALRERIERERNERMASHAARDEMLSAGEDDELSETLKVVRHEYEALRSKFEQLEDQNTQLQRECAELKQSHAEEALEERVNEAIRLERLQICQERAEISRREHQITLKLKQLESQLDNSTRMNDADARFQAFRERLGELHQQEQDEYRPPSISQRLVKLWHSLDGPTDTD